MLAQSFTGFIHQLNIDALLVAVTTIVALTAMLGRRFVTERA